MVLHDSISKLMDSSFFSGGKLVGQPRPLRSDMAGKNRSAFSMELTPASNQSASQSFRMNFQRGSEGLMTLGRSLKSGVTKAMFPEDLKVSDVKIFDPQDRSLLLWNRLFVISCLLAVSVDPLFLYLPVFQKENMCLHIHDNLAYTTTTLRSVIDAFYLVRMILQFRTAFIAPSSRVFGRGELVIDPKEIANRYIHRYFFVDLASVLPLPQVVVWRFLHQSKGSDVLGTKRALVIIVFVQYIPRFLRFLPLISELKKTAGVFAETAWAGAAYYLLWFLLASHVFGALWYLLAVERKDTCWDTACRENPDCNPSNLYCAYEVPNIKEWRNISKAVLEPKCGVTDEVSQFKYGIYLQAVSSGVLESELFVSKYLYCLWWGLQNLSTLGQGLITSTYPGEVIFSIAVAIFGLLLFALLIGNMQVPLFANMDDRLLDAICERLKPSLYTEKTYVLREGDPVDEMLFIIRGRLESVTTDGGRSGFFNRGVLKEGDFCGEELLTWALDPKSGSNFPPSTRTVKALTEVEAFALIAEELKFITSQFRRIHSRQVQQTFRFYSQQWRTWAATFIQAAWRRYRRKRHELSLIGYGDEISEDYSTEDDGEMKTTCILDCLLGLQPGSVFSFKVC
ncbi:putative cyclic nucleotide-gated ion channel 8 [Sesamum angolense]|uniref:Cyclic nucleotide-gated ion channel 8 n=1 Tax=Sesamum angolense TaxID=2727404 RepID=A0AAE1XGG9_9LAMI|nr:putative cyclic nucleotide-gated ion channel 8 [Sesamum angolense]